MIRVRRNVREIDPRFIGVGKHGLDGLRLGQLGFEEGALGLAGVFGPATREGRGEGAEFREAGVGPFEVIGTRDAPFEVRLGTATPSVGVAVSGGIAHEGVDDATDAFDGDLFGTRREGAHVVCAVGRDDGSQPGFDLAGGGGSSPSGHGARLNQKHFDGFFGLGGAGEEGVVGRGVAGIVGGRGRGAFGGGAFGFAGGRGEEVAQGSSGAFSRHRSVD
mmetsp:Transcript_18488/g.37962  ORF Transcript_18488/g.37962 Transcript_18488/m.37962 type:complete len:219 (-) Transcript_18488:192-848(-)